MELWSTSLKYSYASQFHHMYVWTNFVQIVTLISFKISSRVYIYKQIQFYILIIIARIGVDDTKGNISWCIL